MMTPRFACLALATLLVGQLNPSGAAVCQYRIQTRTDSMADVGTNAVASVRLYGSEVNCGWRTLNANGARLSGFNFFVVTCPCLGCIRKIEIKHNNAGADASWYLSYVAVRSLPGPSAFQRFSCYKWLSNETSLVRELTESRTPYKITVYTGSKRNAGTDAEVEISLRSSAIWTGLITLDGAFEKGSTRVFSRIDSNICPLKNVYIRHNNAGAGPNWYLKLVDIYNAATNVTYRCRCNRWIWKRRLSRTLNCKEV